MNLLFQLSLSLSDLLRLGQVRVGATLEQQLDHLGVVWGGEM